MLIQGCQKKCVRSLGRRLLTKKSCNNSVFVLFSCHFRLVSRTCQLQSWSRIFVTVSRACAGGRRHERTFWIERGAGLGCCFLRWCAERESGSGESGKWLTPSRLRNRGRKRISAPCLGCDCQRGRDIRRRSQGGFERTIALTVGRGRLSIRSEVATIFSVIVTCAAPP